MSFQKIKILTNLYVRRSTPVYFQKKKEGKKQYKGGLGLEGC